MEWNLLQVYRLYTMNVRTGSPRQHTTSLALVGLCCPLATWPITSVYCMCHILDDGLRRCGLGYDERSRGREVTYEVIQEGIDLSPAIGTDSELTVTCRRGLLPISESVTSLLFWWPEHYQQQSSSNTKVQPRYDIDHHAQPHPRSERPGTVN